MCFLKNKIFIPGNTPSSKNSKVWTGKYLIPSKPTREYLKTSESFWIEYKQNFLNLVKGKQDPLKIGFYFYRDSKRRFDYVNIAQCPLDCMVKYGWLADDSASFVIPVFIGHEINKKNPGLDITIL